MKIQGANLGEKEVEYKLLSEYPFFNDIIPFPQKDGKF